MNQMRIVFILLCAACGLQGCGLKGPLVLPAPAAQSAPVPQPAPPAQQQDK
ncbi:MAG: LPS translocon maturation chaperone LptM [Burkholderiales bacterium]